MDYTKRFNKMTVQDLIDILDMYKGMYGPTSKVSIVAGPHSTELNTLNIDASYSGIHIWAFDTWSSHQDENNPKWFEEEYKKDQED